MRLQVKINIKKRQKEKVKRRNKKQKTKNKRITFNPYLSIRPTISSGNFARNSILLIISC